jgi:hypothetical protein
MTTPTSAQRHNAFKNSVLIAIVVVLSTAVPLTALVVSQVGVAHLPIGGTMTRNKTSSSTTQQQEQESTSKAASERYIAVLKSSYVLNSSSALFIFLLLKMND